LKFFGQRREPREAPEVVSSFSGIFTQGPDGGWHEEVEEDKDVRLLLARTFRRVAEELEAEAYVQN